MGDSIAVSDTSNHEEDTRISDKEHKENSTKRSSTSQKEKDDVKKRKDTNRVTTVHQDRDDAVQQSEHKAVDASKKKQVSMWLFFSKLVRWCQSQNHNQQPDSLRAVSYFSLQSYCMRNLSTRVAKP